MPGIACTLSKKASFQLVSLVFIVERYREAAMAGCPDKSGSARWCVPARLGKVVAP